MKRIFLFALILALALAAFTGCSNAKPQQQPSGVPESSSEPAAPSAAPPEEPVSSETQDAQPGGITLAEIRKAAQDSGYPVTDGHHLVFMSDVKGGISAEINADGQNTVYSFVECETEDAAIKNAKDIDDAGYNIAIRSGRFITCYSADKKDGTVKDILSSLLEGNPVEKQSGDDGGDKAAEQPGQQASDSIAGAWVSGAATGEYNAASGKYENVSGMGLIYTFYEDGTFAQLIAFGKHMVTTGKYSVQDGLLTLTERVYEESPDEGKTWENKENLPEASCYYLTGTDDSGRYLLLGQEGAVPPLDPSSNASKLSFKE